MEMTLEEFSKALDSYHEHQTALTRQDWERDRIIATILISPHLKKPLTPQELIPLPWDNETKHREPAPVLTKEQRQARINELLARTEQHP